MGEKKLPKGVTVRKEEGREPKIRLSFTYKGIHCRETLDLAPTPPNLKYAERLLGEIKNGIERGTFRYADQFPKSSKLKIFGSATSQETLGDFIDRVIEQAKNQKASPHTIRSFGYRKDSLGKIIEMPASAIDLQVLKQWVISQRGSALATIQVKMALIRQALDEAMVDGLIQTNPARALVMSRYVVKNKDEEDDSSGLPDPFTMEEKAAILDACTLEEYRNLFTFAFETGMRTGELMALRWNQIDWIGGKVHVTKSMAIGVEKSPKTRAGVRQIDLSPEARAALISQRKYSEMVSPFVFLDPMHNKQWVSATMIRQKAWIPTLKRARVRYRKPYNTRHTFATMHISRNANIWWLAKQMGHRNPTMLFEHYGTYLEGYDDAKNSGQNLVQR